MRTLPHSIQRLIQTIGWNSTTRLLKSYGGTVLYVPDKPDAEHPLRLLLNDAGLSALITHYGGKYVELPTVKKLFLYHRNNEIIDDLKRGLSIRDAALKYGISKRMVRYIKKQFVE